MTGALPLADATLAHHAARAAVPTYDRAALRPGVVHISVGSFHRAHQAVYFDDLAERRVSADWGIVGVGLRRRALTDALAAQDRLFTVVTRHRDRHEARVVGSMTRMLFAPEGREAVIDALTDPRTRLVTLTITAAPYRVGPPAGGHETHAAFAHLVAALDRRRRAGVAPFTVLSCDNLPDNGALARDAVVALAARRDAGLARWIEEEAAFPNSMADRITPGRTPADRALVATRFGIDDRWPVMTEAFSQWVVEDAFCNGRPPLEQVGVQIVDDVRPYALAKTRLLNAGHCALGYLGTLAGHEHAHGAIADPVFAGYVRGLMAEVSPLLPPTSGIDLPLYRRALLRRLQDPGIADPLARLCRNGSAKMPAHVLSSITTARELGLPHDHLTLAVAAWALHLRGTAPDGRPLPVEDPEAERLGRLARAGGGDPRHLLAARDVFGELGGDPAFAGEVQDAMAELADGVRPALAAVGDGRAAA